MGAWPPSRSAAGQRARRQGRGTRRGVASAGPLSEIFELSSFGQQRERLLRRLLVNRGNGVANVDEDIVADLGFRNVGEACLAHDAAEVDACHTQLALAFDGND